MLALGRTCAYYASRPGKMKVYAKEKGKGTEKEFEKEKETEAKTETVN